MSIMCYQLMNGQDLIGEVVELEDHIVMRNPAAIHLVPAQNGSNQFGIALMPYAPYADLSKIKIFKDKISIEFEPTVELRNNYSKMFGSGIEIANVMPR
jgi:hypothetical protein